MLIDKTHVNRTALQGEVAVVTGAGQGIGREAARLLAHLGAAVVIAEIQETGRDTEALITTGGGARYSSKRMSRTRRAWSTFVPWPLRRSGVSTSS